MTFTVGEVFDLGLVAARCAGEAMAAAGVSGTDAGDEEDLCDLRIASRWGSCRRWGSIGSGRAGARGDRRRRSGLNTNATDVTKNSEAAERGRNGDDMELLEIEAGAAALAADAADDAGRSRVTEVRADVLAVVNEGLEAELKKRLLPDPE